jgi:hypothetical protein
MSAELTSGTGLRGRWGLNDGVGTTATNSIGGSPAGTLTNGTTWVTPGFPSSITTIVSFQQGVNGYTGTVDNFLSTLNPDLVNGNETHFEWDQWESGNEDMPSYGLLRFENIFGNGVNQIPDNVSIISAIIKYTVTDDPGSQGTIKEATSDWDESSTFNNFPGDPEIQGTTIAIAPSTAGTHSIDVTSSINGWLSNPSSNKGWIFISTGTDGTSAVSSEAGTVQNRPQLIVSFIEPTSIPLAPDALPPSNIASNEFKANWTSSLQATSYRLDVSENSDFTQILTNYNDLNVGNTTSYTVTGLSLLTTYYYRVRAENTLGTSDNSNFRSVTTTDVADALFLDGTDTYIKVNDAPGLRLISFTVETWFKKQGPGKLGTETGTGGLQNIIPLVTKGSAEVDNDPTKDINYFLCITSSNTIAVDLETYPSAQNYPLEGITTINDDQWYHAAATYNGNTLKLYLNGNLEDSLVIGLPPAYESLTPVALGSSLQSNGYPHASYSGYFDGTLDEVRIWNVARTQTDIQSTINSRIVSTQTGLVARWAMDEGRGNLVLGSAGTTFDGEIINSNYQWVSGAPFNLDFGPLTPILISPALGSTVSEFPILTVAVSDNTSTNLTVKFYGRVVESGETFTLIGLPDTQYYVSSLNGGLPEMFTSQTQWIVDNKDELNISYVAHLGDCVEHGDNSGDNSEWQNAENSISLIEDPLTTYLTYGIPYGIAVGNHDQSPNGNPNGTTTFYNQFFGESRFISRDYYGDHYGSNNDNHYDLFSAGGMDFIVIYFEYDTSPDQPVLDWADALLTTFSNRRAIAVTHNMLGTGNPGSFSTQGQAIYDALKDHSNLFLMLGGHVAGEGQRSDTFNGNTVHSLLSDYQSRSNGGHGLLRIMEFVPASNIINVKTFSPYTGEWETDGDSQFSLNYDMGGTNASFNELASITVANNSNANFQWFGLEGGKTYQWYVTVEDDDHNITTGPIWSFSTDAPPQIELDCNVFLQGPFNSGVMTTTLNSQGLIPTIQPFNSTPWNYTGTESVDPIPSDIVDWVLLELRSGTAASTVIGRRAAFLKNDGTVVDLDGSSPVKFDLLANGNYYIVITHRNHLSIMSSTQQSFSSSSVTNYNFTTLQTQAYGTNAMVEFGIGAFGMFSGDPSKDGQVDADDRAATWNERNLVGYKDEDVTMDGQVDADDRATTWNNRNIVSQVPK